VETREQLKKEFAKWTKILVEASEAQKKLARFEGEQVKSWSPTREGLAEYDRLTNQIREAVAKRREILTRMAELNQP